MLRDTPPDHPTDERLPLVSVKPESAPSNAQWWLSTISQVFLGGIGIGAGALYLGPAQTCSVSKDCGLWLSDLIGKKAAVVIFTAGGIDFSAGAMYMGAQSAAAFIKYINSQATLGAKIGKGTLVFVFAASQNTPLLLASLSTSPQLWQTALTVGGNAPGSLFGTINMLQTDIPYFMSKVQVLASKLHHAVLDSCCVITDAEKRQWERVTHYRKQMPAFFDAMNARYDDTVKNCRTLSTNGVQDPLAFLFGQENFTPDKSWFASGAHTLANLTGFLLGINFSAGGVSNSVSLLKFIPTLSLQVGVTLFLSASQLYANLKLSMDGVTAIVDTMVDILRGKPIKSLAFQLRPKTTLLVGGLSLAASSLSFAVIAVLFLNEYGEKDPSKELNKTQKSFLYGAMSGIDIYHFASLFHLYYLLFSVMTRDQKERFLLEMKHEVEHLKKMTEKEFIDFVTSNSPEKNALLGLTLYSEPPDIESLNIEPTLTGSLNSDEERISESLPAKKEENKGRSSWWCSWFVSSKNNSDTKENKSERRSVLTIM